MVRPARRLRRRLAAFLAEQAGALAEQLGAAIAAGAEAVKLAKADDPELDPAVIGRILQAVNFDDWAVIVPDVEAALLEVILQGHAAGWAQIGVRPLPAMTEQLNEAGVAWAQRRAAELVGRRRLANGTLVPNPNAQWAITESTRAALRADVVRALEGGWSNARLARELEEAYAFSGQRATVIARTETAKADVAGNMATYQASGLVAGKRVVLGSEHLLDGIVDECDAAAALGVVPLEDDFGGAGDPPFHPNCVCDVIPVLAED